MGKLANKVAVVTGASKGIGASIAKALAAEGAAVVVNYASSREGADKVVSEIAAQGGKAVAVGGDVSKEADVKALFDATQKALFGDDPKRNDQIMEFGFLRVLGILFAVLLVTGRVVTRKGSLGCFEKPTQNSNNSQGRKIHPQKIHPRFIFS